MNIGKNIRSLRKAAGIKQKELAERAGISNSFLCDIEAERTLPSLSTLFKITEILGKDIAEIFK